MLGSKSSQLRTLGKKRGGLWKVLNGFMLYHSPRKKPGITVESYVCKTEHFLSIIEACLFENPLAYPLRELENKVIRNHQCSEPSVGPMGTDRIKPRRRGGTAPLDAVCVGRITWETAVLGYGPRTWHAILLSA